MDYSQTLKDAQERLKALATQRDAIDREIEALQRIIEGAQIAAQEPGQWDPNNPSWIPKKATDAEPAGVTDSIRKILRRTPAALLPTEIRDALEVMGIEGSSSRNLLIHVHKALSRMLDKEEIVQVPRDGKMAYRAATLTDRMARQLSSMYLLDLVPTATVDPGANRGLPPPPPRTDVSAYVAGQKVPSLNDPENPLYKGGMRPGPKNK